MERGFKKLKNPKQVAEKALQLENTRQARLEYAEQQRQEVVYAQLSSDFDSLTQEQQQAVLVTLFDHFGYDLTENPPPFAIVAETTSLVCIFHNDRNVFAYRTLNEAKADQRKPYSKKLRTGAITGQQMATNGYNPTDEILDIAYERNSWRVFVRYLLLNLLPEIEEILLCSNLDENILNVVRDYTLGKPFDERISLFEDELQPEFLAILELVGDRSKMFENELFGTGKKRMDGREQIALNSRIADLIQIIIKIFKIAVPDITQTYANFEASPISTKGNQSAKIIPEAVQYSVDQQSAIDALRTEFIQEISSLKRDYPQLF
jgi:hypothetical protein